MGTMSDWFPETDAQTPNSAASPSTASPASSTSRRRSRTSRPSPRSPALRRQGPQQLSTGDINEIEDSVSDPKFTIDVAKSDGKLRRIEASMNVKDGSDSASMTFALMLTDVEKPVTINAPSSGRPIQELMQKLFGGNEDTQIN